MSGAGEIENFTGTDKQDNCITFNRQETLVTGLIACDEQLFNQFDALIRITTLQD